MRFLALFLLVGTSMTLTGCMERPGASSDQGSPTEKTDLNVPAPTTYCEKVWACSYENLVQEEARRAMVQKRKAFVTSCEDALRKMPADLVKKYENCTRASCGDELRQCLSRLAEEKAVPPGDAENPPGEVAK